MKLATFTPEGIQYLDPDSKEYWVQRCRFAEKRAQELQQQLDQMKSDEGWRIDQNSPYRMGL